MEDEKDRFGEKMKLVERAREDIYFAAKDRELIEKLRRHLKNFIDSQTSDSSPILTNTASLRVKNFIWLFEFFCFRQTGQRRFNNFRYLFGGRQFFFTIFAQASK